MKHPYIYTGFFVSERELKMKLCAAGLDKRLEKPIVHPHMTLEYRPQSVDTGLFGRQAMLVCVGYGNDGINEGCLVRLESAEKVFLREYERIAVPHITVSVSKDGKPVDTAALDFTPIEPFTLHGVYGAWHRDGRVVTDPDRY